VSSGNLHLADKCTTVSGFDVKLIIVVCNSVNMIASSGNSDVRMAVLL